MDVCGDTEEGDTLGCGDGRAPMEVWWTESNEIEAKMLDGEMGTTSVVKERK